MAVVCDAAREFAKAGAAYGGVGGITPWDRLEPDDSEDSEWILTQPRQTTNVVTCVVKRFFMGFGYR
jgi:hypothetical protein